MSLGPQYEESVCLSKVTKFIFKNNVTLEALQVSLFTLAARKLKGNSQATFIYYMIIV